MKCLKNVLHSKRILTHLIQAPLEAVGINLLILQDKIVEVTEYVSSYLSIESEDCHKVWYRLHVCPDGTRQRIILSCVTMFQFAILQWLRRKNAFNTEANKD